MDSLEWQKIMNIQDVLLIYEYNYWANKRILAQCKNATLEQFTAPAEFPFGGLRGTVVHILDAEFGWRMFLQNNDWSAPELKPEDFPTLDLIQKRWKKEEQEFRAYLATLKAEDMHVHRIYDTPEGQHRDRVL